MNTNGRNTACFIAAGFIGTMLVTAAVGPESAFAAQPLVIQGQRIDPALQRRVSYADLNLAAVPAQRVLKSRIRQTAGDLCSDINDGWSADCYVFAVDSTKQQVATAISNAKLRMAGVAVAPDLAISMVINAH